MSFKEELKTFSQTTSIKGVSRCARSESFPLRCMWGVCIIIGASASAFQLWTLLRSYANYETSTKIEITYTSKTVFPDITICRINPWEYQTHPHIPTGLQYRKLIRSLWPLPGQGNLSRAYRLLLSNKSYKETFKEVFLKANTTNLIAQCSVFTENEVGEDCTPYLRDVSLSPVRTRCRTMRLDTSKQRQEVVTLTAIIYLNDVLPRVSDFDTSDFIDTGKSGAEAFIHPPNTIANVKSYVSLAPGTLTTINLSEERTKKRPSPYSNCVSPSASATDADYIDWDYNHKSCHDDCMQRGLLDTCGCFDGRKPAREEVIDKYEYCTGLLNALLQIAEQKRANITKTQIQTMLKKISVERNTFNGTDASIFEGRPTFFRDCRSLSGDLQNFCAELKSEEILHATDVSIQCLQKNASDVYNTCKQSCDVPCLQFKYTQGISSTLWPHRSTHLYFYKTVIANQPYAHLFKSYGKMRIIDFMNETANSPKHGSSDNINSNFLKLVIQLDNSRIYQFEETPLRSLTSMMGSLGGILNLWIGISFVTLIEVVELLFKMMVIKKRPSNVNHVDPVESMHKPQSENKSNSELQYNGWFKGNQKAV